MTPPAFGTTVQLVPGDRTEVDAAERRLRDLDIRHVRIHLSYDDYAATVGVAWHEWLLPRLGGEFDLLSCVHDKPSGVGGLLREVIERHGKAFDAVSVAMADTKLAELTRALGKYAVLTLSNPLGSGPFTRLVVM